jgi:hypothetical protein
MEVLYQLSYPGGSSDSRREASERAGPRSGGHRGIPYPPEPALGLNGTPELRVVDFQPSGSCFITK